VPGAGLEPARPFGQWILSPSCLPDSNTRARGENTDVYVFGPTNESRRATLRPRANTRVDVIERDAEPVDTILFGRDVAVPEVHAEEIGVGAFIDVLNQRTVRGVQGRIVTTAVCAA
jgi:hypothetical protein